MEKYTHNGKDLVVFGTPEPSALEQAKRCLGHEAARQAVLCADNHKGYGLPIGGVVAYEEGIAPAGVGYDIGCGNLAVRTDLRWEDIRNRVGSIMDAIYAEIPFGIGRKSGAPTDHPLFESETWKDVPEIRPLKDLAFIQLGTVGSGNHYVDLFVETSRPATLEPEAPEDHRPVWVGVHFGSRGFGWKTAAGFMKYAMGLSWDDRAPGEKAEQPVDVITAEHENFHKYLKAMQLAGEYAYAGRERVVSDVLQILARYARREVGTTKQVHNHHNYAWLEEHDGKSLWVVRKGATPLMPGQRGFVGGSMGDIAVILRGLDTGVNRDGLYSAMHGAGRVMSRTAAAGKRAFKNQYDEKGKIMVRKGQSLSPGRVDEGVMRRKVKAFGVELRGAGADEAPDVYRPLRDVIAAHVGTLEIEHVLKPVGVAMAGADIEDPYKD
jgi:tRNA-splicing ligase RtcB